jgi:hypothetical protein
MLRFHPRTHILRNPELAWHIDNVRQGHSFRISSIAWHLLQWGFSVAIYGCSNVHDYF